MMIPSHFIKVHFYFSNAATDYLANLYLICVIFSIFISFCQILSVLSSFHKKEEHLARFFGKMLSVFLCSPDY